MNGKNREKCISPETTIWKSFQLLPVKARIHQTRQDYIN